MLNQLNTDAMVSNFDILKNCTWEFSKDKKRHENEEMVYLLPLYNLIYEMVKRGEGLEHSESYYIWKYLLLWIRLEILAENLGTACNRYSNSLCKKAQQDDIIVDASKMDVKKNTTPNATASLDVQPQTLSECLRSIFLLSRQFRVFLALVQWCEWRNRIDYEKNKRSANLDDNNSLTQPAHLRYSNTTAAFVKDHVLSTRGKELPLLYHLDFPFSFYSLHFAPTKKNSNNDRESILPTTRNTIVPADVKSSANFFQKVYSFLKKGELHQLCQFTSDAGEPWINSLVAGQLPYQQSDSLYSVIYDASLNDVFASIPKHFLPEYNDFLGMSSWIHGVVLERSSEVIATNQTMGEEFNVGNNHRELFVHIAQSADHSLLSNELSTYERAFYGYISGSIDAMLLPVTSCTEALWSHCIALQEYFVSSLSRHYNTDIKQIFMGPNVDLTEEIISIFQTIQTYRMSSTKDAPWSVMFEEIVKFSLNPSYIIELLSYVDNLLKLDTSLKKDYWIPFMFLFEEFITHDIQDSTLLQIYKGYCHSLFSDFVLREIDSSSLIKENLLYTSGIQKPEQITACAILLFRYMENVFINEQKEEEDRLSKYHGIAFSLLKAVQNLLDFFCVLNLLTHYIWETFWNYDNEFKKRKFLNFISQEHITFSLCIFNDLSQLKITFHQDELISQICILIEILQTLFPILFLKCYYENSVYLEEKNNRNIHFMSLDNNNYDVQGTGDSYMVSPDSLAEIIADNQLTQSIQMIEERLIQPTLSVLTNLLEITHSSQMYDSIAILQDLLLSKLMYCRSCEECYPFVVNAKKFCWDSVALKGRDTKVDLTPLAHFFSMRHIADILMILKDVHTLSLVYLSKLSENETTDINELSNLFGRLTDLLCVDRFVESPYKTFDFMMSFSDTTQSLETLFLNKENFTTNLGIFDRKLNHLAAGFFLGYLQDISTRLTRFPVFDDGQQFKSFKASISSLLDRLVGLIHTNKLVPRIPSEILNAASDLRKTVNAISNFSSVIR